jgi:glycerol-3-phosphate acyltransferase PlsX
LNIIIDGFGGDLAPKQVLLAARAASDSYDVDITVTGDSDRLADCAKVNAISLERIAFAFAETVIPMDGHPKSILKEYSQSSMAVGLKLLADGEGDAFVSGGSTGALLMGATFFVKRIRGVRRPAIASLIPTQSRVPYLLVDMGANHDCRAEMLAQFAVMGSVYSKAVLGIESPRVALVNIGTEEAKGDELRKQAYPLLSKTPDINFIGNIEPRSLPIGGCDVAVCDGFTGNVILKLSEGFGEFFSRTLRSMLTATPSSKLAGLLLKGQIGDLRLALDYKKHGGAPFLGIARPVIKAHGSSDAEAFKNAIRQAILCCNQDICRRIERQIAKRGGEEQI